MKAGLWLHYIRPQIGEALRRAEELVFELNRLAPSRREEREAIIRRLFGRIGRDFTIHSPFHCDFGEQISIGDHFVGNFNLTILDEAPVTIGDHVFIGPNVGLYTVSHALLPDQRNAGGDAGRDDRQQHGDRRRERRHARHPRGGDRRRVALPGPAGDHRSRPYSGRILKKKEKRPVFGALFIRLKAL